MHLTAPVADLTESFTLAASVIRANTPRPILQNVLLRCNGEVVLEGTDLEVGLRLALGGDLRVEGNQAVVLPGGKFGQILRSCRGGEVTVAVDAENGELRVHAGTGRFRMPSEDPDLFPRAPEFPAGPCVAVPADALLRALDRTMPMTDVESTRYALGGCLLEPSAGNLRVVATDGRRLGRQDVEAVVPEGLLAEPWPGQPVAPAKFLKAACRLLKPAGTSPVELAVAGGTAFVRVGEALAWGRLLDGRFPRYQDVFPATKELTATLAAGDLRHAVERAAIMTSEDSRGVDFAFAGGRLDLKARAAERGTGEVEAACDLEPAGGRVEVTFEPRYVLDALRTLAEDDRVELDLLNYRPNPLDPNPVVLRTADGFTCVIMPLTRDR